MSKPKSPCIGQCNLGADKVCTGCFRTESQIAVWNNLNDSAKELVLKQVEERKKGVEHEH